MQANASRPQRELLESISFPLQGWLAGELASQRYMETKCRPADATRHHRVRGGRARKKVGRKEIRAIRAPDQSRRVLR